MSPAARRDGRRAAAVALVARLAVVAWAGGRFPAAGDGFYYDTLARRLAEGQGYTWLWPDGAVTHVAHYPVGYPAMIAPLYLVLGARPLSAMLLNAVVGAAMALAVHRLVLRDEGLWSGRAAMGSALVVAVHPALVPYTAAVMTEGVAAALLVGAVAIARRDSGRAWIGWVVAGLTLGVATLVRPQCILFAPLLGLLAPRWPATWRARARAAAIVSAVALAVCAPWTARNCVAMHQCALVSVNGGWNLLIGTQTVHGGWQPADFPAECRTVWDEAAKDTCLSHAARAAIARDPLGWIARAPAKLATTFDYFGAGPWYLHESNPVAFDDGAKTILGTVETVASVVILLFALAGVGLTGGPRRPLRIALVVGGAATAALLVHGWIAYAALAFAILALGPRWLAEAPIVIPWTAIVLLVTGATHVVFFGAGRYGLVVVPFVTSVAFSLCLRPLVEGAMAAGPTSRRRSPVFIRRREESPSSTEHDAR